jgi:hypothetical protein
MKKTEGVNYYSGEKVSDIAPTEIPEYVEGLNITDSNYVEEIYSDAQLEKHSKSNINVFAVNGIPSRWEHNKLRSTWHFDPKADPQEETFITMCKFKGDWKAGIDKALKDAKEQTIGNYRPRNQSKQDHDLHEGELLDILQASNKQDVSCMYHHHLMSRTHKDTSPEYEIFFKMLDAVGLDIHQMRVHIQLLGQVTPFHIDQQMRYARPEWRQLWLNAGADKNPLKLRRLLISLNPWDYGHVWQFGNTCYQGYDAGECITYDWCNMPHGTANFGYTPRITLQATGFITEKTEWLMKNGSKNHVIEV